MGRWSYEDVQDTLSSVTGGNPLPLALLGGLGLGGAGYLFGPRLLHGLVSRLPGVSPQPLTRDQFETAQKRMGLLGAGLGALPGLALTAQNVAEKGWGGFTEPYGKEAALKQADVIDYTTATRTIQDDPYLDDTSKARLSSIFDIGMQKVEHEGQAQGLLTTGDLIQGAVGAGLGWGTAALAGPFLGKVFSLPEGTQRKFSNTGLLAGAILGSGVIK